MNRAKIIRSETLSVMNAIISFGIKNGEFRRINPEDLSILLESAVNGYYYGRHWQDKKYDLETGTQLIFSYFLDGIKKNQ